MRRQLARLASLPSLLSSLPFQRSRWLLAGGALLVAVAILARAPAAAPTGERATTPSPTSWSEREAVEGKPILAGYPSESQSVLALTEPDWPALLLDIGAKLLLTVGLVYVSLYLLRQYMSRTGLRRRMGQITVVETVQLGQHRALHLVRVGGQLILLGATSTQISLLAEVSEPAEVTTSEVLVQPATQPSFQNHLHSLLPR